MICFRLRFASNSARYWHIVVIVIIIVIIDCFRFGCCSGSGGGNLTSFQSAGSKLPLMLDLSDGALKRREKRHE
jgi:hypothetical protein